MRYSEKMEIDFFDGNAKRNLGKIVRSRLIEPLVKYCQRSGQDSTDRKPLRLQIRNGNPRDAQELFSSVAVQEWRKRVTKANEIPKGYTKSPKLGAQNYAFSKGFNPTDVSKMISCGENCLVFEPEVVPLIVDYYTENMGLY